VNGAARITTAGIASTWCSKRGLRPAKPHENRPELIYPAARSGEVETSVEEWTPYTLGGRFSTLKPRLSRRVNFVPRVPVPPSCRRRARIRDTARSVSRTYSSRLSPGQNYGCTENGRAAIRDYAQDYSLQLERSQPCARFWRPSRAETGAHSNDGHFD